MAVATTRGFIRIYNLSSKSVEARSSVERMAFRDATQEHNSKYIIENVSRNFYKFQTIKINQAGNKVAVTYLEVGSGNIHSWNSEF